MSEMLISPQRPVSRTYGAPPHVGWWLTGYFREEGFHWRWWDGEYWGWTNGKAERHDDTPAPMDDDHGHRTRTVTEQSRINWCWHWPADALIARVNPKTGEVTGSGPKGDWEAMLASKEHTLLVNHVSKYNGVDNMKGHQ